MCKSSLQKTRPMSSNFHEVTATVSVVLAPMSREVGKSCFRGFIRVPVFSVGGVAEQARDCMDFSVLSRFSRAYLGGPVGNSTGRISRTARASRDSAPTFAWNARTLPRSAASPRRTARRFSHSATCPARTSPTFTQTAASPADSASTPRRSARTFTDSASKAAQSVSSPIHSVSRTKQTASIFPRRAVRPGPLWSEWTLICLSPLRGTTPWFRGPGRLPPPWSLHSQLCAKSKLTTTNP